MFTNVEVFSRNEPEVTKAFRFTDQHRKVIFIIITFLGVFREKVFTQFFKIWPRKKAKFCYYCAFRFGIGLPRYKTFGLPA